MKRQLDFLIRVLCLTVFLAGFPALVLRAQEAPHEVVVFVDRAILAYDGKQYEQALKELQEALRLDPDSADALYYQGLVYIGLNRNADAQASLEKARGLRPEDVDIAFQLGVHYFNQQQFDRAEPPLRQVYKAEPRRRNIGYYLGLIEFRKKNYRAAVDLFRATVPSDDNFAQLSRFYSGLAMGNLGFAREARNEIEEAMRLQPASPLTAPAQRFGEVLQSAADRERFFHGEIKFGVYYDTNVPVVPNASSDLVAQTIRGDQGRRKSEGELATMNLSYMWLRTLDWEGTVSYRFLQTYNNHLTEFNTQSHTPTLGLTYKSATLGMPYFAGMQWTYDFITLGNRRYTERWIVNPYFSLQENSGNLTNLQFRFQAKNFFDDQAVTQGSPVGRSEIRDALNYMVGLLHVFLFDQGRHSIKVGYQFDTDRAEGKNWDYRGHRLLIGGLYTLPWGAARLRYDLDYHWRFHPHKNSLLPVDAMGTVRRRDNEPVHLVSIAKDFVFDFSKSFSLSSCDAAKDPKCSFTVSLEYLFDRNRSNLKPYDYERHVVTTSLAWRF